MFDSCCGMWGSISPSDETVQTEIPKIIKSKFAALSPVMMTTVG
jgi:hypothetical protein